MGGNGGRQEGEEVWKLPKANPMQLSLLLHQLLSSMSSQSSLKVGHSVGGGIRVLEVFGYFCQPAMHTIAYKCIQLHANAYSRKLLDGGMQFAHNPNFVPVSTFWIICQLAQLVYFVNVMSCSKSLLCFIFCCSNINGSSHVKQP